LRSGLAVVSEPELKPTKSALKKAARAARKQLQQAKSKASRDASPSDTPSLSPSGSAFNPVEIPREAETPLQKPEQTPLVNGAAIAAATQAEPIRAPEISAPEIHPPLPQPVAAAPQPTAHAPPKPIEVPPPAVVIPAPQQPVVAEKPAENPALAEQTKKRQNVATRTLWTFIMIGTFLGMSPVIILSVIFNYLSSSLTPGAYVYDSSGHAMSDPRLSRGHGAIFADDFARRRIQKNRQGSLEHDTQLVLLRRHKLLPVWREYHLLFQGVSLC
jgi:hypothetical protein